MIYKKVSLNLPTHIEEINDLLILKQLEFLEKLKIEKLKIEKLKIEKIKIEKLKIEKITIETDLRRISDYSKNNKILIGYVDTIINLYNLSEKDPPLIKSLKSYSEELNKYSNQLMNDERHLYLCIKHQSYLVNKILEIEQRLKESKENAEKESLLKTKEDINEKLTQLFPHIEYSLNWRNTQEWLKLQTYTFYSELISRLERIQENMLEKCRLFFKKTHSLMHENQRLKQLHPKHQTEPVQTEWDNLDFSNIESQLNQIKHEFQYFLNSYIGPFEMSPWDISEKETLEQFECPLEGEEDATQHRKPIGTSSPESHSSRDSLGLTATTSADSLNSLDFEAFTIESLYESQGYRDIEELEPVILTASPNFPAADITETKSPSKKPVNKSAPQQETMNPKDRKRKQSNKSQANQSHTKKNTPPDKKIKTAQHPPKQKQRQNLYERFENEHRSFSKKNKQDRNVDTIAGKLDKLMPLEINQRQKSYKPFRFYVLDKLKDQTDMQDIIDIYNKQPLTDNEQKIKQKLEKSLNKKTVNKLFKNFQKTPFNPHQPMHP